MSDQTGEVRDLEAPEEDAFEQALRVEPVGDGPVESLSVDLEVPEPDAIEQHQAAVLDDDDSWR